jgi:hypothetical protein
MAVQFPQQILFDDQMKVDQVVVHVSLTGETKIADKVTVDVL